MIFGGHIQASMGDGSVGVLTGSHDLSYLSVVDRNIGRGENSNEELEA